MVFDQSLGRELMIGSAPIIYGTDSASGTRNFFQLPLQITLRYILFNASSGLCSFTAADFELVHATLVAAERPAVL